MTGGSGGAPMVMQAPQPAPVAAPPAPGSLTQTIIGGSPGAREIDGNGGTVIGAVGPVGVGPANLSASTPWEAAGLTYAQWLAQQRAQQITPTSDSAGGDGGSSSGPGSAGVGGEGVGTGTGTGVGSDGNGNY